MTWSEHLHPRNPDGEFRTSVSFRPPHALVMGYRRVGDHPTGAGREHDNGGSMPMSAHPDAGGLWIDPNRPGSKHAPAYRNDMGWLVTDLKPKPSRSSRLKGAVQERRRGDTRGRGDGLVIERSTTMRDVRTGDTYRERSGGFGYGTRGESATVSAPAFVAQMKRARPRARQEMVRQPKRRTPRGTVIENWMMG